LNYFLGGGDPGALEQLQDSGPRTEQQVQADDELAAFSSVVLADNEDVWNKIFAEHGSDYQEPVMVLYRQGTQSGCGMADKAVGPFYCPADNKIYLDLSFFEDLQTRFGAAGDFAMAYVISHEVGHHIQYLMGTTQKMDKLRQQVSKREYNKYSVMLELQADFYAGVWAHHAQKTKQILALVQKRFRDRRHPSGGYLPRAKPVCGRASRAIGRHQRVRYKVSVYRVGDSLRNLKLETLKLETCNAFTEVIKITMSNTSLRSS
jgi:predicted metalloprotease